MITFNESFEFDSNRGCNEQRTKVYIVLKDEDYNNYDIKAVFFDEKKAKKFIEDSNPKDYDIWRYEEHEVK